MAVSHGSIPFKEQIDYFHGKVNLPTRSWTDIYTSEHDYAFVVAGAVKRELLVDLRAAVEKSIANGTTLEQFRKDFDQVVGKHGWQYQSERGWRTNVIWETNLRQSYNAGREAQMADPELRKRQGLTIGPAPAIEWEDRVIGKNSPNGSRTVRVPKGIDPGFEYAPGQSRLANSVPQLRARDFLPAPSTAPALATGLPSHRPAGPLPLPRSIPAKRLQPAKVAAPQAVTQFLGEFGATDAAPAVFRDVTGEALVVGREMFTDAKTGAITLAQQIKVHELPLLIEAIKTPDEIWARLEWHPDLGKATLRRRYLMHGQVKGKASSAVAVFDQGDGGWNGATGFVEDSEQYLEPLRQGVLLYRRPE
ncbi:PBECR2 nuclease fold domain-containing protein [Pseudomonas sp. GT1P32]